MMKTIGLCITVGLLSFSTVNLLAVPHVTVTDVQQQKVVDRSNLTGVVRWFDKQRGFGVIRPADGKGDVFVHFSTIISKSKKGKRFLRPGQRVRFGVVHEENGKRKTRWVMPI
jgi:CspA family cold shock protein